MRDHSEGSLGPARHDAPAPVLAHLEQEIDPARLPLAREVAAAMVRRLPQGELDAADPDALAEEIAHAFALLDGRQPGELATQVADVAPSADGVPLTAVDVCVEDRPFLLSTLMAEVHRHGHQVVRRLHPILGVQRGPDGRLRAIEPARGAEQREALVHLLLDRQLPAAQRRELETALRQVLGDVIRATGDYPQMRAHVERVAAALRGYAATGTADADAADAAELLDWLLDHNFLLLGTCEYDLILESCHQRSLRARPQPRWGILSDDANGGDDLIRADPAPLPGRLLDVVRSLRISNVHRRARLVNVWVEQPDEPNRTGALFRLVGLFTRQAAAAPSSRIPVLRRRLAAVLEREQVVERSHDEQCIVALFEAIPKEELFELDDNQLHEVLLTLFAAEEQLELRVVARIDRRTASATILVSVPRDRYDAVLRERLQDLVRQRFGDQDVHVELSLADRPQAILCLGVAPRGGPFPDVAVEQLEAEVRALTRGWDDRLRDALTARSDPPEASRLFREVGGRLPAAYRDHAPLEEAVADILGLDELARGGGDLRIRVHEGVARGPSTRVKLLKAGPGVELSAILPILESLGLTVSEERPFRLEADGPELHIHDYGVHDDGGLVDVTAHGERLADAILAAWKGRLEVDSLNRLVLRARLDWRSVTLLRTYRRYRRQIGTVYTADYQNDTLTRHPQVVRGLIELFDARFNPDRNASQAEQEAARQQVLEACEAVERLDDDRIVRSFLALVDATLRTNHYAPGGSDHLALKFDSAAVPHMPRPVPYREIFVSSPEVEGIHLRGGPVARGGIRWSDRRDDFRTEVLGLMKAQMLKNAVIVPSGAKGGFVLKQPPEGSDLAVAVRRQYELFTRALLEVTDNIVDGEVVTPPGVRRADGDDPYLVVAPDRGTAKFSDHANAIAEEHGFWLGDAFAAGGSHGYDHKRLGITARGAWAAARRHFRELRIDVATEPVTVVGIGDMSGDVFGNGMLQAPAIRLVAAFDHRHIFLDPDPDPERAYAERKRLFAHPEFSWQDYDRDAVSDGGGVWSRSRKRIPLSKEVQGLLRVDAEELTPPAMIRAILKAPVDLLFAGGIGTFVKASSEPDEDIGDRANDELRIDAADLRARVYAEGANLSITPRARVQYARRGGRINADFIDNCAGVDLSDHEVNLKILLRDAVQRGELGQAERDELLEQARPDVVAACLRNVEQQTWVLTQDAASSPASLEAFETLLAHLEAVGRLDRDVDAVPSAEEMAKRREVGAGLTRPELAVVLAVAKQDLATHLAASDLPDQPALRPTFSGYFPPLLAERFDHLLDQHRLRREITATVVANDVVNHMGITFVHRLARDQGIGRVAVVAAYWIARETSRAEHCWDVVEQVERAGHLELALAVKAEVDGLVETLTREYLRAADLADLAEVITRDGEVFGELERILADAQGAAGPTSRELVESGIDAELVHRLALLPELAIAPSVARVSRAVERDVDDVGEAFLAVGTALRLARLRRLLDALDSTDRWTRWQRRGLEDDLRAIHRLAVHRALVEHPGVPGRLAVDRFMDNRREAISHANRVVRQAVEDPDAPRLDALSVAVRAIRDSLAASASAADSLGAGW